jgi:hypothetical protein
MQESQTYLLTLTDRFDGSRYWQVTSDTTAPLLPLHDLAVKKGLRADITRTDSLVTVRAWLEEI